MLYNSMVWVKMVSKTIFKKKIPSWRLSRHSDCFSNPTSESTEFLAHSLTGDVYDVETKVSRSQSECNDRFGIFFRGKTVTLCSTTVGYTSKRRTSRVLRVDWSEVNNVTFGWHRGDDARTHLSSCLGNAWTDQNRSCPGNYSTECFKEPSSDLPSSIP